MPIVGMPDGTQVSFPDDMPQEQIRGLIASKFPQETQKSVSGFFSNAGSNAADVAARLYGAVTNPVKTAKDLGKLGIGMAEEAASPFANVPQGYAQQYAEPFYRQVGHDLGFRRAKNQAENIAGGIAFDPQQLGENLYKRPLDVALDVGMVAAPVESIPGRIGRAAQTIDRFANPVNAAGRTVTSVAKRVITPNPARAANTNAANILAAEGVDLTAGQATGNKALKYAESEIGGRRATDLVDAQGEQFTRAAAQRIGENTDHLDPATLLGAYRRIGNEFNTIGRRTNIGPDPQLANDAQAALAEYQNTVPVNAQVPAVAGYAQIFANAAQNGIAGQAYVAWRSRLSRLARNTKDPQLKAVYGDLQNALDDAAERHMAPADVQAFATARRQYRNYLVLEDAMAVGGQQTAAGILTPGKLEAAAASGPRRRWYAQGLSDFTDLAKAGKVGMTPMPESGTASRAAAQTIAALPGAVVGGLVGGGGTLGLGAGLGAAVGGAVGRNLAGRALMSRPVQAYLRNQVFPGGMTAVGRVSGVAGRATVNAAQRQQALKQTEDVLSPSVLSHMKTAAPKQLNDWVSNPSDDTARALAGAVAKEVKRPDLEDRIYQELISGQAPAL